MLNKLGDFGFKLGTILLAVLTVVIITLALLGLFGIGFGYLLSAWVFNWVTTNLGLDYHAANFATAIIVFLICSDCRRISAIGNKIPFRTPRR